MKKILSFIWWASILFFLYASMGEARTFLPPVQPLSGSIVPNDSGISKIKTFASNLLDLACATGQYQVAQWLPINIRQGLLSSMVYVRATSACSSSSLYSFSSDYDFLGSSTRLLEIWGYGSRYLENTSRTCTSGSMVEYSNIYTSNYYGCHGYNLAEGLTDLAGYRVTGREIQTIDYFPNNYCCQAPGNCKIVSYITLVTPVIATTDIEFSTHQPVYLAGDWEAADYGEISLGDFSSLGGTGTGAVYLSTINSNVGGTYNDNAAYQEYRDNGFFDLADSDIASVQPGVPTSSYSISAAQNFYSSATVNVDLGPVTDRLDDIHSFLTDTSTAGVSTAPVFAAFSSFQVGLASAPIFSALYNILPTSTQTWSPCFDMSSLWSGYWAGSKPESASTDVCLTDFPGFDTLVLLIRFALILGVMVWGFKYIWGGY